MDTPKNGSLGRGLGHLVNEASAAQTPVAAAQHDPQRGFRLLSVIRIDDQHLPPPPPDDEFNAKLKESIRLQGVLQPIVVQRTPNSYRLLAGRRRLQAARELELGSIPAIVMNIDDDQAAKVAAAAHMTHATDSGTARTRPVAGGDDEPSPSEPPLPSAGGAAEPAALPGAAEKPMAAWRRPWIGIAAALILAALVTDIAVRLRMPVESPPAEAGQDQALVGIAATETLGRYRPDTPLPPETIEPEEESVEIEDHPAPPTAIPAALQTLTIRGVSITGDAQRLDMVFDDAVFDYPARMTDAAQEQLSALAQSLAPFSDRLLVRVTGHTDNQPLPPGSPYRNHDELGLEHAQTAANFLGGIVSLPPGQMMVVSRGKRNPPFSNETPDSRLRNRTITIAIRPLRRP